MGAFAPAQDMYHKRFQLMAFKAKACAFSSCSTSDPVNVHNYHTGLLSDCCLTARQRSLTLLAKDLRMAPIYTAEPWVRSCVKSLVINKLAATHAAFDGKPQKTSA